MARSIKSRRQRRRHHDGRRRNFGTTETSKAVARSYGAGIAGSRQEVIREAGIVEQVDEVQRKKRENWAHTIFCFPFISASVTPNIRGVGASRRRAPGGNPKYSLSETSIRVFTISFCICLIISLAFFALSVSLGA